MGLIWMILLAILLGGFSAVKWVLKRVNWWLYESHLGDKQYSLPPGDLGWPFVGSMWSFLRAFKSNHPDSFIDSFVSRFGQTGIYKALMYGNPSVIVTTPEACKRVLNDDDAFIPGWPRSTMELMGKKSLIAISHEEHKRLRRLTAAPVNGHEALNIFIPYIEEIVKSSLEKWTKMGEIEFLTQLRKLTFKIIMYIFLSSESEDVMDALEKEYTIVNYGVRAMAINIPGFVYYKALKARKKLVAILQSVVTERRNRRKMNYSTKKKDMLDILIDSKNEQDETLDDEEIIDIMFTYLNAGHESSAHTTMWATVLLQQHPEFLERARVEQERIMKKRSTGQKGITLNEIREMDYLSKVADETLRFITFSLTVFREAVKDVNIGGYLIPKGWKVLVWFRGVHYDPENYPNPREFNPSRWDDFTPKAGSFLPFGGGSRLCPGNDLAKLEIMIFLHHFLLNYRLERLNPESKILYLPHTRPVDNCLARIKKLRSRPSLKEENWKL